MKASEVAAFCNLPPLLLSNRTELDGAYSELGLPLSISMYLKIQVLSPYVMQPPASISKQGSLSSDSYPTSSRGHTKESRSKSMINMYDTMISALSLPVISSVGSRIQVACSSQPLKFPSGPIANPELKTEWVHPQKRQHTIWTSNSSNDDG